MNIFVCKNIFKTNIYIINVYMYNKNTCVVFSKVLLARIFLAQKSTWSNHPMWQNHMPFSKARPVQFDGVPIYSNVIFHCCVNLPEGL